MQVTNVSKGRTVKVVTIENVAHESDTEIVAAAVTAAGETLSSLFGANIDWVNGYTVKVSLYTD